MLLPRVLIIRPFTQRRALLLKSGLKFGKHSGVISAIHQHFVKTEKLDKSLGKNLNWLFELRGIGDYGVFLHVKEDEAKEAIKVAQKFLDSVKALV